jgi:O-antigen/teichoic acid export membrane protein
MALKKALLRNAFGAGFGQVSLALFRLVQVPLLLSSLGVEEYGRWLVLVSLPSWLALTNMGFGSVGANEITMAVAANNWEFARSCYSTTLALLATVGLVGSALCIIIAPFIPWERVLAVGPNRHDEIVKAVIYLGVSVFISFLGEVFNGRFRAARKAHFGMILSGLRPWLDLAALVMMLRYSTRFDQLALALLGSAIVGLFTFQILSLYANPDVNFSFSSIHPRQVAGLLRKGSAFQAFPAGNAILYQGNLLVVQSLLGPTAVAVFGTARTLVRSVSQLMAMINQITWPEFSILFGSQDLARARRLHRLSAGVTVTVALLGILFLAAAGQTIFSRWTGKRIELPEHLLLFFLLPIPFNALYSASGAVQVACNQHEGLALRYVGATILSLGACVILSKYWGIEGAAISTILVDFLLLPYVVKQSLKLTGDSWLAFIRGMALDPFAAAKAEVKTYF